MGEKNIEAKKAKNQNKTKKSQKTRTMIRNRIQDIKTKETWIEHTTI